MDEHLLPKTLVADASNESPLKKEFPSNFLDINTSLQISSNNAIPIITTPNSSLKNLAANFNKKRKLTRRSNSAPSVITNVREAFPDSLDHSPAHKSTPSIVRQAFIGVVIYSLIGTALYTLKSGGFKGQQTLKLVDALYYTVVTLCTIGYGDIVPNTTFTKLFTCVFILVGFGIIDILLNGLVTYILDQQEALLLSTVDENRFNTVVRGYVIDTAKGRMRIRMKVCLALVVVIYCIATGTVTVHYLEERDWVNSFYLSVTSVTTVGYGDYGFNTLKGRCFAIVWLLVSTLAVARAFLYLTELRIEKRSRRIAKWVLQKKMTIGDLVAADLDRDGSIRSGHDELGQRGSFFGLLSDSARGFSDTEVNFKLIIVVNNHYEGHMQRSKLEWELDIRGSIDHSVKCKSEFIIYKLKEMGKIAENDILQICNQFDMLDNGKQGKLTIADLMESDPD